MIAAGQDNFGLPGFFKAFSTGGQFLWQINLPGERFADVPPGNVFYNFVDRLAVLNITLGCTPDHSMYCPNDPVTRGQMAAFLVRAFNL